jgi:hypothetical protein
MQGVTRSVNGPASSVGGPTSSPAVAEGVRQSLRSAASMDSLRLKPQGPSSMSEGGVELGGDPGSSKQLRPLRRSGTQGASTPGEAQRPSLSKGGGKAMAWQETTAERPGSRGSVVATQRSASVSKARPGVKAADGPEVGAGLPSMGGTSSLPLPVSTVTLPEALSTARGNASEIAGLLITSSFTGTSGLGSTSTITVEPDLFGASGGSLDSTGVDALSFGADGLFGSFRFKAFEGGGTGVGEVKAVKPAPPSGVVAASRSMPPGATSRPPEVHTLSSPTATAGVRPALSVQTAPRSPVNKLASPQPPSPALRWAGLPSTPVRCITTAC